VVGGELNVFHLLAFLFVISCHPALINSGIRPTCAQCRAGVGQRRVERSSSEGMRCRTFIERQHVEGRSRGRDSPGEAGGIDNEERGTSLLGDHGRTHAEEDEGLPRQAHTPRRDTVLIERILARGKTGGRADDNIHTALERIRTYHKYHQLTLDFLREEHVPIVNLDGSATAEGVWEQLRAVGEATDYMLICSLLRFAIFQFAFSKNRSRAHARITNPLISYCPRI